jgi:hypothetical protein
MSIGPEMKSKVVYPCVKLEWHDDHVFRSIVGSDGVEGHPIWYGLVYREFEQYGVSSVMTLFIDADGREYVVRTRVV